MDILSRLPQEIVRNIFIQLKISAGLAGLLSCLLSCRRWHHAALPVLYRDIVLANPDIPIFLERFNHDHACFARSLSICLETIVPAKGLERLFFPVEDVETMRKYGSFESQQLWSQLQALGAKIRRMKNLSTFSLNVFPKLATIGFWIPRTVIAQLIDSLSLTCVNVEIDTRGYDFSPPSKCHLCEHIQQRLPRLQHLRLRVNSLCPTLLERPSVVESEGRETMEPGAGSSPSLRTIVINCNLHTYFPPAANHTRLCCNNPATDKILFYDSFVDMKQARIPLTEALKSIVDQSVYPMLHRVILLDYQSRDIYDAAVYAAYNQRNIIDNVTLSMPFIMSPLHAAAILRMPGREIISHLWITEALAEGGLWKDSMIGSRLPNEVMARDISEFGACVEKDLETPSRENRELFETTFIQRRGFCLWENESATGLKLLDAMKREGLTDTTPIREITPAGWVRYVSDYGSRLKAQVTE
ncbi:MAG: hypothetical protein MMC33_007950 [Icmadophila ericetorum]|nr:hypothetical protein [Icmadophila ericetorum]